MGLARPLFADCTQALAKVGRDEFISLPDIPIRECAVDADSQRCSFGAGASYLHRWCNAGHRSTWAGLDSLLIGM